MISKRYAGLSTLQTQIQFDIEVHICKLGVPSSSQQSLFFAKFGLYFIVKEYLIFIRRKVNLIFNKVTSSLRI